MAKEALFNILRNHYDFEGLKVLDLFAGIGSLSYEFATRDAAEVHSVELNPRCVSFITETTRKLNLKNLFVIRANVFTYLSRGGGKKFDIIFADPPYDLEGIERILLATGDRAAVAERVTAYLLPINPTINGSRRPLPGRLIQLRSRAWWEAENAIDGDNNTEWSASSLRTERPAALQPSKQVTGSIEADTAREGTGQRPGARWSGSD